MGEIKPQLCQKIENIKSMDVYGIVTGRYLTNE